MVGWPGISRYGPIGVDIGSRCVKLVQLTRDRTRVHETAQWDLPAEATQDEDSRGDATADAIARALEGRSFRGSDAVLCLSAEHLFVKNVRVAPASGEQLHEIVHQEAANRLPFDSHEAEIRYLEAADVRQGENLRREVILLACPHAVIQRAIDQSETVGLRPVAIDVEPTALVRCYSEQYRRERDRQNRMMFVNIGASNTMVTIAKDQDILFVKYIEVGGDHFDQAVAQHLRMPLADAAALRRHNGDRRESERDPEITKSLGESIRPVLDQLANELALCLRYHSVTFRGQTASQLVLGGGEANEFMVEWLQSRLDISCELGNPLRRYEQNVSIGRPGKWDIAVGLALREVN